MISGHVFIATSLDGFIARENGDIAWLLERDDPTEDHGYEQFIAAIDTIVMGRGTFETIREVEPWPYTRPIVVLSQTLAGQDVPQNLDGKVRFMHKSPVELMAMLDREGIERVYVDGGLVVQSFLRLGLIADMVITRVPVLLGGGRALFGSLPADIAFTHEETTSFPSGLVQSRYRVNS